MRNISVLIPAHNEEAYLADCFEALLSSDATEDEVEIIVIANGCTDETANVARAYARGTAARGWRLKLIELEEGNKLAAWNAGEAAAEGKALVYLDADVRVSAPLLSHIAAALDTQAPRYASGLPRVTIAGDWVTRHYTRFWKTTPFMTEGVPGFGLFAMNRAGRSRWGPWPDIISDDTYARLNFRPKERVSVPASYDWPMIEGFKRLVQVRRRQDVGVAEIERHYPALIENDDPQERTPPLWKRALRDPSGFAVFAAVRIATFLPILRSDTRWARGR